jgi:drug/metabolite transporter (DMT)-like permease
MKVAIRSSDPFTFMTLRTVLGALALFVLVAARRGSLRPKHFWVTALYSVFGTSMTGLTIWALSLGSAGKVSILTYTMPFWLLFIAWPVLAERIQGAQWIAVTIALLGLVCVLEPWNLRGVLASVLATIGGLSWAIASVFFKIIRKRYEVEILSFTAWQALIGSVPLIVVSVIVDHTGPTWNAGFIGALLFNVIVASAFAWVLWLYVLHNLPAGTAGVSTLAIPVVGVASAWIQLGERPGAFEATGIGLILLALAILTARELVRTRRMQGPA